MKSVIPVGLYDSGIGGLTVWLALKKIIDEDLIYYGDLKHVPYGDKSREEILFYSYNIISFLQAQGAKLVVAACNTSSALALPKLHSAFKMPIFGVIEPAVEKALATTKNNRIGLMATVATVKSGSYQNLFSKVAPHTKVFAQACPKLVPLIEAGILQGQLVTEALYEYLDPLINQGIDTLVLGCTHYPFLLPEIQKIVGDAVQIVDPAWQTALNVQSWIQEHGARSQEVTQRQLNFWVSGNPAEFQKRAAEFIGYQIDKVHYHQPPEALPDQIEQLISKLSIKWGDD